MAYDPRRDGLGLSQARVLLLLDERGPVAAEDVYWRSRAASGTWSGTRYWLTACRYWATEGDQVRITPAGSEAVRAFGAAEPGIFEKIRAEWRAENDPYWTARRR